MHPDQATGSWSCVYCKTVYRAETNEESVHVLNDDSGLNCPVCSVPLARASLGAHQLGYCTQCHGLLIAVEVFVSLLDELRAKQAGAFVIAHPADSKELERRIKCPQCGRQMDTHFYGGPGNVIIDDCSACELNWLDQGELTRIVRAPEELS